jgi:Right handed beta helix region
MRFVLRLTALVALLVLPLAGQATLSVPGQFPSILNAAQAAVNGDTIEVAPGTYFGFIEYFGKDITIRSTGGAEVTIIDASKIILSPVCFIASEGPNAVLDGFTIRGGQVSNGGGIFLASNVSPTIRNCIIRDNFAFNQGGGARVGPNSSPTFSNCVFTSNFASTGLGSAVSIVAGASATFEHCTIAGNGTALGNPGETGGIFCDPAGTVTLVSSILHSNASAEIFDPNTLTASYSIIEDGDGMGNPFAGTANQDANPQFADLANGDLRLTTGSPAIDAADGALATLPSIDVALSPRVIGGQPDMGAFEFLDIYPGSGLDLELSTGVNGPENFVPEKSLMQSDGLLITLASPGGTYVGAIPVLVAQFFASTGAAPGPLAGFPEIWVDTAQNISVIYDGNNVPVFGIGILPPQGLTLGFVVPPGLAGQSAHVQGLVLQSNPSNPFFTASSAVRLNFM